jgi:hypothetical protein
VRGDGVLFVDPRAEVYELAALGAEGAEGIIFKSSRLVASRAFHGKSCEPLAFSGELEN